MAPLAQAANAKILSKLSCYVAPVTTARLGTATLTSALTSSKQPMVAGRSAQ